MLRADDPPIGDWIASQPELKRIVRSSIPDSEIVPTFFTRSQLQALQRMSSVSSYYFSKEWRRSAITPRTALLLAGPTGIGKSHLVRNFARSEGMGFLRLSFGDWLPVGSRGDCHTVDIVEEFISHHERCLIFFDEYKLDREYRNDWTAVVLNELYALLDRTWFDGSGAKFGRLL
jgi:SpoVK/Ycf46/Vps4 family AAA+-type ATPase